MFSRTTFVLALAASASAHLRMADPAPFSVATLNSSPLEGPQDFPCKQRPGMYNIDFGMNQWNAGETKEIVINGTAVHGGGSCQFSITTDPEPTKDSQWKVIHSVIGNCLTSIKDNFPDPTNDPKEADKDPLHKQLATRHPVTLPKNLPDGRYTFAWSWLNKLGNREFYMNCAPIQVGSGSGTASTKSVSQALSALPDMFVANLPNTKNDPNGCQTTESQDFVYPDPGQSVLRGSSVNVTFGATLTGPGCAAQQKMAAGAGSIGSPSPGTPSTPSQSTAPYNPPQGSAPSQPSYAPSQPQGSQKPAASPNPGYGAPQPPKIPSNPGGVFAPGASSAPAPAPAPAQPAPPAATPVPSAAPQTPGGGDNNTTPSNGECTPCTNDGAVVCIGSKQFGLCNRGCAVAQDLAAGMSCSGGAVVASAKRHVHFPRAHLHRRFSAARFL